MRDPFQILGVLPQATENEVQEAYRTLAKKYHPCNYQDASLAEYAAEKMKEIDEAYDAVISEIHTKETSQQNHVNPNGFPFYSEQANNSDYPDLRRMIQQNCIVDAEQILNTISEPQRKAEWYFLKGSVLYKKGWLEDAHIHFHQAHQMDSGNTEYSAAYHHSNDSRQGNFGGYNPIMMKRKGCSGCDVCAGLLFADCCCECMGKDFVPFC